MTNETKTKKVQIRIEAGKWEKLTKKFPGQLSARIRKFLDDLLK
ncbi:MAG: hypothetical protein ACYSTS_19455 [Planctomycetota bacterium]